MPRHRTFRRVAAATIGAAVFSSLSFFVAPPVIAGQEYTVEMSVLGFTPEDLEVPTGSTITWKNVDPIEYPVVGSAHQLKSTDGTFDSGRIAKGASYIETFNDPIEIWYVCEIHPHTMAGALRVTGPPVKPPVTEKTVMIVEDSPETTDWSFRPKDLQVTVGTTVIWRNSGSIEHHVTDESGMLASGPLKSGETYRKTFNTPVAISYYCEPHPWMKATLVVAKPGEKPPVVKPPKQDPGGSGGGVPHIDIPEPVRHGNQPTTFQSRIVEGSISDPQSWGFAPDGLTVRKGDTVVWTNAGTITHTVTAKGGEFDSGDLSPSDTFSYVFRSLGMITFACKPHPWMTGAVRVVAPGSDATSLPPPPPAVPVGDLPGDGTTTTPSDPTGSAADASPAPGDEESPAMVAWTRGSVSLALWLALGIFVLGALIAIPGVIQLRRARRSSLANAAEATESSAEESDPVAKTAKPRTKTPAGV